MASEGQIQAAIAEKQADGSITLTALARKYNVNRSTLSRRLRNKTCSRTESVSRNKRNFSDIEEQELIAYMERLSNCGIYLTPRMLNNIAGRRLGRAVGRNWSARFVRRNAQYLTGVYLNGFDKVRKIAQQPDDIDKFFENVERTNVFTSNPDARSLRT